MLDVTREPTTWTTERHVRLMVHWMNGLSASVIAEKLNEEFKLSLTRNAVIGRAHRTNLTNNDRPQNRIYGRWGGSKKRPKSAFVPAAEFEIPMEQRKTFVELEPHHCRWPVGHPNETGFFYCGGRACETRPYCVGHCSMAYQGFRA